MLSDTPGRFFLSRIFQLGRRDDENFA